MHTNVCIVYMMLFFLLAPLYFQRRKDVIPLSHIILLDSIFYSQQQLNKICWNNYVVCMGGDANTIRYLFKLRTDFNLTRN